MVTEHKGILVFVYQHPSLTGHDPTNGGISAKAKALVVVGTKRQGQDGWTPLDSYSQVHIASEDAPAAVLVQSRVAGFGPHLEPLDWVENGVPQGHVGPMMGGNYAATADDRFAQLGLKFTGARLDGVPIHDRMETEAMYRVLSMD